MIYEVKPEDRGSFYVPDQTIPESDKNYLWAADNIRYICSFYNRWPRNSYVLEQPNDPNVTTATNYINQDPVQYMLRMMMYYLGRQPNLDYNHLTQNVTTSNLMPDWLRGKKIYSILSLLKDNMLQIIENADFDVKTMSEDAISQRKKVLDSLMIQHELQPIFDQLRQEGVDINAAPGQNFSFPEDVEYYMERGYKDMDSEIMTRIAQSIWLTQSCQSKFLQAFMHANTAGRCGMEHYVANGNYYQELHLPINLIMDTRVDDDYNRKARFVGAISYKTPDELKHLYGLDEKTYQDIKRMSYDKELGSPYNTVDNMVWWNYSGGQQFGTVACVRGYWITLHDLKKKKTNTKHGVERIIKISETDKQIGDYVVEDVFGAVMIGNKYVVDPGYIDNVVEDYYNKSRPKLPIMIYSPNMFLGESRSITSYLHELQDKKDAYTYKISEMVGRSVGKGYFIKGWMFGNNDSTREMFENLKSIGIHVQTHPGEPGENTSEKVVEMIDMTLDPNVMGLTNLIAQIDAEMMEIAKVSSLTLGTPQKYMGVGSVQNTMKTSSGSTYIYSAFLDWIQMNMQYGVDVLKNLFSEDETDYPEMIIGKRGVEYLKLSKKMKYSNPLVFLTINDFIEAQQREHLLADAHAALQNKEIDFVNLLDIETAKTFTELKDKLKLAAKKNNQQKEHEKAVEQQLQQLSEQNKFLQQQIMEMMKQSGKREMSHQDQAENLMNKAIDLGTQQAQ